MTKTPEQLPPKEDSPLIHDKTTPIHPVKSEKVHELTKGIFRPGVLKALSVVLCLAASIAVYVSLIKTSPVITGSDTPPRGVTSVAFIGNSMFYFNDFPRFFEEISHNSVQQNSCLHGGASISSLLIEGNAMYPQFQTPNAVLGQDEQGNIVYDYGACTVPQLLVGFDERIHDPGYAVSVTSPDDNANASTMANPCREDPSYLEYTFQHYGNETVRSDKRWDFVLINDNTRNPSTFRTRANALQTLERFYVEWFLSTGAIPVFLWTHAYSVESTERRNMTGLEDVANFTSLTGVGYQAYADLLSLHLPEAQKPRIAPVGLAFLTVYEEDFELWQSLFHCDHIHASPSGSFLQGLVVHHTLFGELPDHNWVVRDQMKSLWHRARMMQHAWEPPNPFPTRETAKYLYRVAERILVEGHLPKSFIAYQHGEVADNGNA